jgi:hypothetical protein
VDALLSAAVLAGAILGGASLIARVDRRASRDALLCAGAPVGIALLGLVGLLLAKAMGLNGWSVGLAAAFTALPVLGSPVFRLGGAPRRRDWRRAAFWAAWGALLFAVFRRVFFDAGGGIAIGNDHNLGDLPFHFAITTGFLERGAIPPEHPELAGVPLTYPYLADFVAAMLMKAGAPLRLAFLMQNLVLAAALVGLLFRLGLHVTRERGAALLTPVLVFLSGGLGFLEFLREGGPYLERLASLTRDYTITWDGRLRFGNMVSVLLVPQRTLLLGLPLALLAFLLVWRARVASGDAAARGRLLVAAGGVAGLLPLAHAHSFAVVLCAAVAWIALFPPARSWVPFFAMALLVALPQLAVAAAGSALQAGRFLEWLPGWDRGAQDAAWFWFVNAGLFLPLSLVAPLLGRGGSGRRVRWAAPFLALFVVANLLRLSPWIWDNVKFLVYWHVGTAPLVAAAVIRSRRLPAGRFWSAAAVVALTASGALDVWRMASGQIRHRLFDAEAVAAADGLRETTPPRSIVLHLPTYDSPVYLAGRRSVLGYPGHIDSQGLQAGSREEDVRRIYAGADDAAALLRRYAVSFVLLGPQEEAKLPVDREFLTRFPVAGRWGRYRLYRVTG